MCSLEKKKSHPLFTTGTWSSPRVKGTTPPCTQLLLLRIHNHNRTGVQHYFGRASPIQWYHTREYIFGIFGFLYAYKYLLNHRSERVGTDTAILQCLMTRGNLTTERFKLLGSKFTMGFSVTWQPSDYY